MILKHPAFPANTREVPDEDAERWQAAGWLPLLDEAQTARFRELEAEVDAATEDDSEDDSGH